MPRTRVLVVDDAVVMRKLITEALGRDAELEVVGAAANGRIALQKIPQLNPDILTLDVEMPEMDGLATLREVRKIYPKLPVIMFSTLTAKGAGATLDALSLGANDYVTKPSNVGSVTEAIGRLEMELTAKIKIHCRRAAANGNTAELHAARIAPGPYIVAPREARPHRYRMHRNFHRRTECTGRTIFEFADGFSGAHCHRAAHAADVHGASGGTVDGAFEYSVRGRERWTNH